MIKNTLAHFLGDDVQGGPIETASLYKDYFAFIL